MHPTHLLASVPSDDTASEVRLTFPASDTAAATAAAPLPPNCRNHATHDVVARAVAQHDGVQVRPHRALLIA